jgi:acyl carrier protein
MSERENRLIRCFASVFPGLTAEELRTVGIESSSGVWDSLSTVTLAAVVEEEFDLEIDEAVLPELDSFPAFLRYLSSLPADSGRGRQK